MGETDKADLFKDLVMLQRLSELDIMEATEKMHILHVLDSFSGLTRSMTLNASKLLNYSFAEYASIKYEYLKKSKEIEGKYL